MKNLFSPNALKPKEEWWRSGTGPVARTTDDAGGPDGHQHASEPLWSGSASSCGNAGVDRGESFRCGLLVAFFLRSATLQRPHLIAQFLDGVGHFLSPNAQFLHALAHLAHCTLHRIGGSRTAGPSVFPAFHLLLQLTRNFLQMLRLLAKARGTRMLQRF